MAEINFDGNISVRVIENGILVKCGPGWVHFKEWDGSDGASEYVYRRIEKLKSERAAAPR